MMNRQRAAYVRRELQRLCHRGLEPFALIRRAQALVREVVPYDASCWLVFDPASLLVTGGVFDYPRELMPALARNEWGEDDFNKLRHLARQPGAVALLSRATERHLERSPRYREILRPAGLQWELRAVFRADAGTWGSCALYRGGAAADFEPDEALFIGSVSGLLAAGIRRSLAAVAAHAATVTGNGPGLVVLSPDGSIEAVSPDARRWLDELSSSPGAGDPSALHPAITYLAGRTRAIADGVVPPEAELARARILTSSGRWLLAHATTLEGQLPGRSAVILEAASPTELAPLIVEAYGLSQRERQITELVLRGASTNEMAGRLGLSPLTVQDHLKAVFEKLSVRSRREVAARIFYDHHFPPALAPGPSGTWQFDARPGRRDTGRPSSA